MNSSWNHASSFSIREAAVSRGIPSAAAAASSGAIRIRRSIFDL
jgi:hypothetical protein